MNKTIHTGITINYDNNSNKNNNDGDDKLKLDKQMQLQHILNETLQENKQTKEVQTGFIYNSWQFLVGRGSRRGEGVVSGWVRWNVCL